MTRFSACGKMLPYISFFRSLLGERGKMPTRRRRHRILSLEAERMTNSRGVGEGMVNGVYKTVISIFSPACLPTPPSGPSLWVSDFALHSRTECRSRFRGGHRYYQCLGLSGRCEDRFQKRRPDNFRKDRQQWE